MSSAPQAVHFFFLDPDLLSVFVCVRIIFVSSAPQAVHFFFLDPDLLSVFLCQD